MNQLLLTPTDTLFFRDGRPMEGSLTGHGAIWPLPTVTNAALHAALHDAKRCGHLSAEVIHHHDHMRGVSRAQKDIRAFGSLTTAGPFPVSPQGTWFFHRPLDLTSGSLVSTLVPRSQTGSSSLPKPLTHILSSDQPPSKHLQAKSWLSVDAFNEYLRGSTAVPTDTHALDDNDIFLAETAIGIAIDPATATTGQGEAQGKIYSSQSLRLQAGWRLGLLAQTDEKQSDGGRRDLIVKDLFRQGHRHLILGGQQRVCTVEPTKIDAIPLPRGLTDPAAFRSMPNGGFLVKWVLLSPAIFPAIESGISKRGTERKAHPGGWLPTWVEPTTGRVLLERIDEAARRERRRLNYNGQGYSSSPNVPGRLIAARVDKPIPVTGWSNGIDELEGQDGKGGAKPTHLAVSSGSVYYFVCDTAEDAHVLAGALNWHGSDPTGTTIKNRRSTLLGEKGFGLGVCGTWIARGNEPR